MALMLHLNRARAGTILEQRWTRQLFHFGARLHWSILPSKFSQIVSAVPAVIPGRAEIAKIQAPARHTHATRLETLMRVVAGSRQELGKVLLRQQAGTALERRFSLRERAGAQFHTSARATEHYRSHRTERVLASPMAMTLRREHVGVASRESREVPAIQERPSAVVRRDDLPPSLQQAAAAAAINLDQMADHVIRQLDRRVVARRERMGRI